MVPGSPKPLLRNAPSYNGDRPLDRFANFDR